MAHHTRVRTFGGWAAFTTLDDVEMEKFDAQLTASINGDTGGSWAPSSEIAITGALGMRIFHFKAGINISGNPAFEVSNVDGTITLRGSSVFTGASTFDAISTFNNVATFDDDVIFNSDVIINQTITLPSSPGGSVVGSSPGTQPYFEVTPAVTFTNQIVNWRSIQSDLSNPLLWNELIRVNGGSQYTAPSLPAPADGAIQLFLSPNCTYSGIRLQVKGSTHSAFPPAVRASFVLQEIDPVAGTTTPISNTVFDTNIQAVYDANHTLDLTGITAFRPRRDRYYYLRCVNESGTNSVGGYALRAVEATGTINRFGMDENIPL